MKKLAIIVLVAASFLGLSSANANTDKSLHTLLGQAPSGTRIPAVEATSPVPFDLSYSALNEDQKRIVNQKYENLGFNDTPPFPAKGLRSVYKPVIAANRALGEVGTLHATAVVSKDGYVTKVTVHQSPSKALAKKAERALRNTKFDAATCNGEACEMTFPVTIKFI